MKQKLFITNKEICVSLLCKTKRNYFRQINTDTVFRQQNILGNNKSSFFQKKLHREPKNETVTGNYKHAETFNTFLSNIAQKMRVNSNPEGITSTLNASDPVFITTEKA